jgi:hypothetical protein
MVREIVTTDLAGQAVLPAFVTAMIWGYGDESYGSTRVCWVLTGVGDASARGAPVRPDVPGLLESAARIVHDGPVEGFRHMNNAGRIKHLGSAFFTKWLYFASATTSADDPSVQEVAERRVEATVQKQPPALPRRHAGAELAESTHANPSLKPWRHEG